MSALHLIGLWGPVLLFIAAVWLFVEVPPLQHLPGPADKIIHAAAYFVFGLLCLRAAHGGWSPPRQVRTLVALGIALGYGLLDEWHQSWVPLRQASAADWVADAAGVALSALALSWWAGRRSIAPGSPGPERVGGTQHDGRNPRFRE